MFYRLYNDGCEKSWCEFSSFEEAIKNISPKKLSDYKIIEGIELCLRIQLKKEMVEIQKEVIVCD